MRSKYIELNNEEDIDKKNQFKIKKLPCPVEISHVVRKVYVGSGLKDPSIIRSSAHVDFNDKNPDNVRFVTVISLPAIREHLEPKIYVVEPICYDVDGSSLLALDLDEKLNLEDQVSIFLNCTLRSPKTIVEIPTKSYVDRLHENKRSRRDLSSMHNDQDNDFDNKILTNLNSLTVNRDPSSDSELANKIC